MASLVAAPRRVTAVPGAPATVLLGNAGNGTLPAPNVATSAGVSVPDVTPAGSVGRVLDVAVGEEVDLGVVTLDAGAARELDPGIDRPGQYELTAVIEDGLRRTITLNIEPDDIRDGSTYRVILRDNGVQVTWD